MGRGPAVVVGQSVVVTLSQLGSVAVAARLGRPSVSLSQACPVSQSGRCVVTVSVLNGASRFQQLWTLGLRKEKHQVRERERRERETDREREHNIFSIP